MRRIDTLGLQWQLVYHPHRVRFLLWTADVVVVDAGAGAGIGAGEVDVGRAKIGHKVCSRHCRQHHEVVDQEAVVAHPTETIRGCGSLAVPIHSGDSEHVGY